MRREGLKGITLCICGLAGSGKSTLAKKIAKHYGLRYYSGGDALKALALERGYRVGGRDWWESEEGLKFLKERMDTLELDREVDRKLLEFAKEGDVVLDSWTMPWLFDGGFKVWLEVSEEVRAKRIAKRDRLSVEEALRSLRERERRTKAIYQRLYGFKLGEDLEPFHLIIDSNMLSAKEVFEALKMVIENLLPRLRKRRCKLAHL
ncbi:MAG: cytidylate kinase [Candidatus Bathyarchaeota archaeon B26-2]|nr:MAG: cytidylate kinase [Candidatus Bathyarchaeota archaeon B26-2]